MIIWVVGTIVVLVLVVMAYFWLIQDRMVFAPSSEYAVTPDEVGLVYESVTLRHEVGLSIVAWYFPVGQPLARNQPEPDSPTVLFFHGNAGNNSHRLETVEFLLGLGASVLVVDYRGYGQSEGSPSEKGVYADARLAWDWLTEHREIGSDQIVIMGRSLGGAVAVDLAADVRARALIVESSFTSAVDMGKEILPFLPVRLLARYSFDSARKMPKVRYPVMVAHSPQDEMIPYWMGQKLYELASEPKAFVELSGGHNDRTYFESPEYLESMREALAGRLTGSGTKSVDKRR